MSLRAARTVPSAPVSVMPQKVSVSCWSSTSCKQRRSRSTMQEASFRRGGDAVGIVNWHHISIKADAPPFWSALVKKGRKRRVPRISG